jgi:SAM-dependent methyltransferase
MPSLNPHQQALEIIRARRETIVPWTGESQLPWQEPDFSRRMLAVHLDPTTQMASRAPEIIHRHLDWLQAQLAAAPGLDGSLPILDVGCGPGLACLELARRGKPAVGFDFAPEPLVWAQKQAAAEGLGCRFLEQDLTCLPADFAAAVGPCDAVTFWFGEFHSFQPEVAADFLPRLAACLRPGGLFVLEYQPWDIFVKEDSTEWSFAQDSALCPEPHLWLQEFVWDEAARTEVHVHWIIELESGNLKRFTQCHQGWTDAELVALLAQAGLGDPTFHPPVTGVDEQFEFPLLVTRKT